jgi:ApbE superfamily uncharacterized protein (UPF0280 family)
MDYEKDVSLNRISSETAYTDRNIYRKNISVKGKYSYRLKYKYTDLFITCDREISKEVKEPVVSFYNGLEEVLSRHEVFGKSLTPVKIIDNYPPIIKKMCRAAEVFKVGPMAAVAGAVCDRIAQSISGSCDFLMIENGGDVYIKSSIPVSAVLFSSSRYFRDRLNIRITADTTPCGLCSSSGIIGHSLSLGKSDLVTVMSESTVMADTAATAIANSIKEKADVDKALAHYRDYKQIKGLIIIKDDRLAIWGELQLVK